MSERHEQSEPGKISTTGHSWDGIEELNTPLPGWWVWCFYATIVFAAGYMIAYPAWPLVHSATPGLLGFSNRGAVEAEIKRFDDANAAIKERLVAADLTAIKDDPELVAYAKNAGAAIFRTNCVQCHGSGAAGVMGKGYPNLLDNDWLWGGDMESIHTTVTHGIRNTTDEEARFSQMPAWGEQISPEEIAQAVQYVRQVSGQENDAALATAGATIFADNCAACHGVDAKGGRDFGAPNLTDAIWLYGGDVATLTQTVTFARFGVMQNWSPRLSEDEIRSVAFYVHGLGGGE